MRMERTQLISELLEKTEKATEVVKYLKTLNNHQLNFKKDTGSWSALECIEHLNLYGDFYLHEIEKRILAQHPNTAATIFKSGIIGNYFANLMLVKNGTIRKMKSPKDKNPSDSDLSVTTIDRFLKQQEFLKSLLLQAKKTDLTRTKTAISLSPMIRLRLGDTFRFFVYHIERHVIQAKKTQL